MAQRRKGLEPPLEALRPGAVVGGRGGGLAPRAGEPGEGEVEPPAEEAEGGELQLHCVACVCVCGLEVRGVLGLEYMIYNICWTHAPTVFQV